MIKNNTTACAILLVVLLTVQGCAAVAGIFKAGMWTGVILVAAVIVLIIYLVAKMAGRK